MSQVPWDEIVRDIESGHVPHTILRNQVRVQNTAEIFTPTTLVLELVKQVGVDRFGPGKKILDPACGDGQFLAAAKAVKIRVHHMTEDEALNDIFGIDIMADNVVYCRRRLGGGTIVIGDALNPDRAVEGQSNEDRATLARLLEHGAYAEQSALFV